MKSKKPKASFPDFTSEASLGFFASDVLIVGVDEVGRGCLAGPVVAAAAVLSPIKVKVEGYKESGHRPGGRKKSMIFEVRDSKQVPEEERGPLRAAIDAYLVSSAIGSASVEEIEKINIYYASHLAMERAVEAVEKQLNRRADHVLVDGNRVPHAFLGRGIPLVKGDNRSVSISCAALIAKVFRDDLMKEMNERFPGYGFEQHKGYGTPFHLKAIQTLGITEIHRIDFRGVKPEDEQGTQNELQDTLFEDFDQLSVPLE